MDHLVSRGLRCITVLDVSAAALARARSRLGAGQQAVTWIEADVTGDWPVPAVDIWHDRALFHFLTEERDRARYRDLLESALAPDALVVVGTFAADGPEQCSGLPTARYGPEELAAALGSGLRVVAQRREEHVTPAGGVQPFTWLALRR